MHTGRTVPSRRTRAALFLAVAAVPMAIAPRPARGDLAHKFDSTTGGDFNTATTWNPLGIPMADTVSGANFGDLGVVHAGTNAVTISSDVGAAQFYVGGTQ